MTDKPHTADLADTVMGLVSPHLRGAVSDGVELGCNMAIDILLSAKPIVASENQTWDSAIAVLRLYLDKYKSDRAAIRLVTGAE